MSRDVFVQDIPPNADTVADIPGDWEPAPLPFTRERVVATVLALVPEADFSDPGWGHAELEGVSIEVSVGAEDPLESFALHVRGADSAVADRFIASLLETLGVRAFDSDSETGIFRPPA